MENIFDKEQNLKLQERLQKLNPESKPLWGKMNVCQMVKHCQKPLEVAEGKIKLKKSLLGLLFGKIAKKNFLKPGELRKNMPTVPSLKFRKHQILIQNGFPWFRSLRVLEKKGLK